MDAAAKKTWRVRLAALAGSAGISGGLVACCSGGGGNDPAMLAYLNSLQSGYATVLQHAEYGLAARADADISGQLGIPFASPDLIEGQRVNFRRYKDVLDEAELYERGLLDPDAPVTPPGLNEEE